MGGAYTTQNLYFFVDDSGTLHKNEKSNYFVYAGYLFISKSEVDTAKRKYINANKQIRTETKLSGELKACRLSNRHKRSLYNVLKNCETFSVGIRIDKVFNSILDDKRAICRYKDYILKRIIKSKILKLIK